MNATIIYLKDGKNGVVEVSMEIIGQPNQSFLLSKNIGEKLAELKITRFCDNEFTQEPPEMLQ
jgi:hypothetical protein